MNEGIGYTRPKQANTPIKDASSHWDGIETHDGMFLTTSRAFSPLFWGGRGIFYSSFLLWQRLLWLQLLFFMSFVLRNEEASSPIIGNTDTAVIDNPRE